MGAIPSPRRVAVVGAGTAGCIVASVLSTDERREVLLLEAGPDRTPGTRPASLSRHDWLGAVDESGAHWPGLLARRRSGGAPSTYLRGRGVGGSASINGMIAAPGRPADYDGWARDHGCVGWAWPDVRSTFGRLRRQLSRVRECELTAVDRALRSAAGHLGLPTDVDPFDGVDGVGRAWVTADAHGRRSSAEAWLDPARARPNLTVRGDAPVDQLVVDGTRVGGVRLATGEEIPADQVVLTAGAVGSPSILLRSGLRDNVGRHLIDHPSACLPLVMSPDDGRPARGRRFPVGATLRASSTGGSGDLEVLGVQTSPTSASDPVAGSLCVALLGVRSRGQLTLQGVPDSPTPRIDLQLLSHPHDRALAHDAARIVAALLRTPALAGVTISPAEREAVDERATDEAAAVAWLSGPGPHVHLSGTCRMGPPGVSDRVVGLDGALVALRGCHIMDASVFPAIPAGGTHLPTAMVALRLAERLHASLT